jgi:hypothetical protein
MRIAFIAALLAATALAQNLERRSLALDLASVEPAPQISTSFSHVVNEEKSVFRAVVFSLLMPGMGELYAGDYATGKYFTILEASLWGAFLGTDYYAGWQEDNYRAYASAYGEVDPAGKDADYYANVGLYRSVEQYNEDMSLQGEFRKMYDPAESNWRWETDAEREEYRSRWLASEEAYNNIQFIVGAMIVNRLASAIIAGRLVSKRNAALEESAWNVSAQATPRPEGEIGVAATFTLRF